MARVGAGGAYFLPYSRCLIPPPAKWATELNYSVSPFAPLGINGTTPRAEYSGGTARPFAELPADHYILWQYRGPCTAYSVQVVTRSGSAGEQRPTNVNDRQDLRTDADALRSPAQAAETKSISLYPPWGVDRGAVLSVPGLEAGVGLQHRPRQKAQHRRILQGLSRPQSTPTVPAPKR